MIIPRIVACQWNGSSPTGPALHWLGGSLLMSFSSLLILFKAMICKYQATEVGSSSLDLEGAKKTSGYLSALIGGNKSYDFPLQHCIHFHCCVTAND